MNYLEHLFNIHAEYWFDLLIWSVLDIANEGREIRYSPFRAALRKNLIQPLKNQLHNQV